MINSDILILGGGASGLMAACAAGQACLPNQRLHIALLEKNDRVGRKLLSTGNGRCNLSNLRMEPRHFHGDEYALISAVLNHRSLNDTLTFFSYIGLRTFAEEGRIYPYSQAASSVLDVLRFETERLGVQVITGQEAASAAYDGKQALFTVRCCKGEVITARKLIITTGGKAAPATGSDGIGYKLLSGFNHTVKPLFPVLTPLMVKHPLMKSLKGIRVKPCRLTLTADKQIVACEVGEVQFTEYGLSGVPAMQVSAAVQGRSHLIGWIDLMPMMPEDSLLACLRERKQRLTTVTAEHFFTGWFHKRVGQVLLNEAHISGQQPIFTLSDEELVRLSYIIKRWPFPITGVRDFNAAQATGGGVPLAEFDPATLASKQTPGLYAAGEVLAVYGDCGGYNLHWAWTTGYLAGAGATAALQEVRHDTEV